MNLVEMIKGQFTDDLLNKVSSLIGGSEGATKSAIAAAVPSLLSALSGLASSSGGSQKIINALGSFDSSSVPSMLSGNMGGMAEKGGGILNSLFGEGVLGSISNAISKFTGLGSNSIKTLLSVLAPMTLWQLGKQFVGRSLSADSVTNLLADQRANISNAMPSGFSMGSLPGLGSILPSTTGMAAPSFHQPGVVQHAATATAREPASTYNTNPPSMMKWLLPLLALACLGLLLWLLFGNKQSKATTERTVPVTPNTPLVTPQIPVEVEKMTNDATTQFQALTDTFTSIKDVATAEAAIPKIREVSNTLGGWKTMFDTMGAAGKEKLMAFFKSQMPKLQQAMDAAMKIPGVKDKLQPVVDGLMANLNHFTK
jgi:hypothetical protein